MFKKGQYVVYGSTGVCEVDEVGELANSVTMSNKMYYTLVPLYSKGSKVFTPIDSTKVKLRSVISKAEANELMDSYDTIELLEIPEEKRREDVYKDAIGKCECREWIRVLKTLYYYREKRKVDGKKITAIDDKYLHMAEENLFGELAITLELDKEAVKELLHTKAAIQE